MVYEYFFLIGFKKSLIRSFKMLTAALSTVSNFLMKSVFYSANIKPFSDRKQISGTHASSADPVQTPQNVVFNQGELQIRGSTEDNFSYFSMKTYVVTLH